MFKKIISIEMLTTFFSLRLFFLFCFRGAFLGGEVNRSCLGLNKKRESWSFLSSNMEIINELKEFHDAYLTSIILGIGTLTVFIISFLYLTKETSLTINSSFLVELSWILVPMSILLIIGFPSIEFIYKIDEGEGVEAFTFKRTGFQWFWSYETSSNFFDSYIGRDMDLDTFPYLSSCRKILLPTFTPIQNVVSSGDVMHRWALPPIIMKIDAIPGRMNTISFSIPSLESSILYGQCSELCGVNHRFIPIVVEAFNLS